jgi:hypothetical protein
MNLSARDFPLDELEDAYEHAEILLSKYAGLLSEQLSATLSAWHAHLMVIIEDGYGLTPADDAGGDDDAVLAPGRPGKSGAALPNR